MRTQIAYRRDGSISASLNSGEWKTDAEEKQTQKACIRLRGFTGFGKAWGDGEEKAKLLKAWPMLTVGSAEPHGGGASCIITISSWIRYLYQGPFWRTGEMRNSNRPGVVL